MLSPPKRESGINNARRLQWAMAVISTPTRDKHMKMMTPTTPRPPSSNLPITTQKSEWCGVSFFLIIN
jgi:hypothetical protein